MLVVDASLLVAAVADRGEAGEWAVDQIAGVRDLAAPHLVLVEVANALRGLEAGGRLDEAESQTALNDALRLNLLLYPFAPFAERAWELRRGLTAYDAWYVALAEALALPLATLDGRLAKADGPRCPFVLV